MNQPPYLSFDPETRHVRLVPHEQSFVQDPYAAYRWLHRNARSFYWEDFGFWCLGGHDDVNRLLRDRRFGREKPAGAPDSQGVAGDRLHLTDFDAIEANS
ncbi:cytochrome P450, partial [Rhizobiaceae sp. 2RAB30]